MSASGSAGIPILIDVDPLVVHVIAGPLEVVVRHDVGLLLGPGGAGVLLVDDAIIPAPGIVSTLLIRFTENIAGVAVIGFTFSVSSPDTLVHVHQEAILLGSDLN